MTLSFTRKIDNVDKVRANDINELQVALEGHDATIATKADQTAVDTANAKIAHVDPGTAGFVGQYVGIGPSGPAWVDEPTFNVKHPRFGAKGDGVTDDTAAIQAAINAVQNNLSVGLGGAYLLFPQGEYVISSTLVADRFTGTWAGVGVGKSPAYGPNPGYGSVIRWNGAAGQPMIRVNNSGWLVFAQMRLEGNDNAIPSYAIEFRCDTTGTGNNSHIAIRDVHIGRWAWSSQGTNKGLVDSGIGWTGTNLNNDQFNVERVTIQYPQTYGVDIPNTQSVGGLFTDLQVWHAGTAAIRTASHTRLIAPTFLSCGTDFKVESTAQVSVYNLYSEHTGRLAALDPSAGLMITGGNVQIQDVETGGQVLAQLTPSNVQSFILDGVSFSGLTTPTNCRIEFGPVSPNIGRFFINVRGCRGINPNQLSMTGSLWATSPESKGVIEWQSQEGSNLYEFRNELRKTTVGGRQTLSFTAWDAPISDSGALSYAWSALTPTTEGRVVVKGPTVLRQERREWLDPTAEGVVIETTPSATYATNNTTVLNQMLGYASSKERDVWLPGKVGVNGSIDMVSEVVLRGRGAAAYSSAYSDRKGSGLYWVGGTSGTLLNFGKKDQTVQVVASQVENITLDGGSKPITLLSIRSNSVTSALYVTKGGTFKNVMLANGGVGIQWGNASNEVGRNEEQADFFKFDQVFLYNMQIAGLVVDGANCGDDSVLTACVFSNCAPAGSPYINLIRSGMLEFDSCSGGGDGANARTFIRLDGAGAVTFRKCQSEKMKYFLYVPSTAGMQDNQPVVLDQCVINDDVRIDVYRRFVSRACYWQGGNLILNAPSAPWQASGDRFSVSGGSHVIIESGGNYRNDRMASASIYEYVNRGEVISGMPPLGGTGAYETVVARSGRRAQPWTASTAFTANAGGAKTWTATTALNVGDKVIPTVPNSYQYTVTVAGTTGSTEPQWHTEGTITDGTVTYSVSAVTNPTFVNPTTDNGHTYRLLTAGTSGATEPVWPTTAGATVADGTCVWQESGPSAKVVTRNL